MFICDIIFNFNEIDSFTINKGLLNSNNFNSDFLNKQFKHKQWRQQIKLNYKYDKYCSQTMFIDSYNSFTKSSFFNGIANYYISNHDLNYNNVNQYLNHKHTIVLNNEKNQDIFKNNFEYLKNPNISKFYCEKKILIENLLKDNQEKFIKCMDTEINKLNCYNYLVINKL